MTSVGRRFTSHRMLMEYAQYFYLPALKRAREFIDDGCQHCRELAAYLQRLKGGWGQLRVESVGTPPASVYTVGDRLTATARVRLGALKPEEVRVELYYGPVSSTGEIEEARTMEMAPAGTEKGSPEYRVELECVLTGRQGYTVRVLPKHPALAHHFLPGLVRWA
jgi:starch phosphorylase